MLKAIPLVAKSSWPSFPEGRKIGIKETIPVRTAIVLHRFSIFSAHSKRQATYPSINHTR